ncbi:MAG: hypothetical protein OXL41_13325 [Nitrospinae bacterium]|nr:hypothetical protein [Nitrospinota bacterium]
MTDNRSSPIAQNLSVALQPFRQMMGFFQPFIQAMAKISQAVAPYLEGFVRYHKFIDSVRATGWLPYHTLSIGYVEEYADDTALLENHISSFYKNTWDNIRQDIESRLTQYNISEETKETFREALSAHEIGHYRCVCSLLFPVIDREFRIHFFQDSAGSISSKKMLEKLTNRGKLNNFLPREAYGWILFKFLVRHLYEPVDDGNRQQYQQDYVPNRHASIHGLLPYSTHKHSINMIIMADYIFQILTDTSGLPSPKQ